MYLGGSDIARDETQESVEVNSMEEEPLRYVEAGIAFFVTRDGIMISSFFFISVSVSKRNDHDEEHEREERQQ